MQMTDSQRWLVEENVGLVGLAIRRVLRFYPAAIDADDLYQIGCVGLCKAAMGYEADSGFCFSTYAVRVITNDMRMAIRNEYAQCRDIRKKDSLDRSITNGHKEVTLGESIPSKDDTQTQTETRMILEDIRRLEGRDQTIARMLLDGAKQREIAQTLGVTQGQASKLVAKLRKRLQAAYAA